MSGASNAHDQIQGNLYLLRLKLRGRKCRVFLSDMRLKVPAFPPYRYPDLAALCGEAVFEQFLGVDLLTNPALIIEILSPSTEAFDRGDKFAYYKSIHQQFQRISFSGPATPARRPLHQTSQRRLAATRIQPIDRYC